MKSAIMTAIGAPLEIQVVPDPAPAGQQAVIAVEASGICRSDWQIWHGDFSAGGVDVPLPVVLGHEVAGVVVAVGPEVYNVRVGDRVMVPFHLSCGNCRQCKSGHNNLCDSLESLLGGFSQYLCVDRADTNLVILPESVSSVEAAAIGCRFMTGYGAVTNAQVRAGDWLLVQGCGGVGLSAIQTARAAGARVIAVDLSPDKLRMAEESGAEHTLLADGIDVAEAAKELSGGGVHAGIDAIGHAATFQTSLRALRKRGQHVQVGMASSTLPPASLYDLVGREIRITGSLGCPARDYDRLFAQVGSGAISPARLVTAECGLSEITTVFEAMSNYDTNGFTMVTDFS